MAFVWGLFVNGPEAVQSLTRRTSLQDKHMLVSVAWCPIATRELKAALASASADAVCGTKLGERRQKLRSGCQRGSVRSAYGLDVLVSGLWSYLSQ